MKILALVFVFLLVSCTTQSSNQSNNKSEVKRSESENFLFTAHSLLKQKKPEQAISVISKVIDSCKDQYQNDKQKFYAARTQTEVLFYMLMGASQNISAVAVETTCADALYLSGYANLEMGKLTQAQDDLLRAVDMAPVNSFYLAELAHTYQIQKNWEQALIFYRKAEDNANAYSPADLKNRELSRAKRGVGFVFIEQGKLDEAEAKFQECIAIDVTDEIAMNELVYIEGLRKKE